MVTWLGVLVCKQVNSPFGHFSFHDFLIRIIYNSPYVALTFIEFCDILSLELESSVEPFFASAKFEFTFALPTFLIDTTISLLYTTSEVILVKTVGDLDPFTPGKYRLLFHVADTL